ncbi:PREDICTED: eukaryotic translation initiation factor 5B [Tarenaya hassleriana]|uniref:eukaryotic translation initiation factor 5B n=1 Tax=Tarenaya hassleriana TaxID=28532 RepID=UPI00053C27AE|nr:PREDICTED: eukaryotic translation initiation factor 5B [Tarenaya hassleriana]
MGRKKPSARVGDDEQVPAGSKSKKKALVIDDDEYSVGTELSEEPKVEEEKVVITGKKKGKKGKKGVQQDDDEDDSVADKLADEEEEIAFVGKKKSKTKKGGGVSFAMLGEDNDQDNGEGEDEPASKKQASKKGKTGGNSFSVSAFDALGGGDDDDGSEDKEEEVHGDDDDDDDDVPAIAFSGKKKKSSKSSKKSGSLFSAGLLSEEDHVEASTSRDGGDAEEEEDTSEIMFSGKKKSSKKKASSSVFASLGDESEFGMHATDGAEHEKHDTQTGKDDSKANKNEEVVETSKGKKKKKNKSGRTAQEEDDLDKILAELGEGSTVPKPSAPPPVEDKVQAQPEPAAPAENAGDNGGEEETVESAAAKKKKKKKEKEKEKKAAAAAAAVAAHLAKEEKQEETVTEPLQAKKKDAKGKAAEKKIPKHVREMQEALARRQEAEERKKREEEERLRKEEEERRRQEELERQAEEARRRKKEREKEKLLKKKQEGKLLTAKQKSEALRREAFKNQLLAAAGGLPVVDKEAPPTKRPMYGNKKKPARQKSNDAASTQTEDDVGEKEKPTEEPDAAGELDSAETERVEEIESADIEENPGVADIDQVNGVEEDDDEDEWDAKSWDDVNLNIKGDFDDEEVDSEAQPVVKKETKSAAPKVNDSAPPAVADKQAAKPALPAKSTESAAKKSMPDQKSGSQKGKASTSEDVQQDSKDLRSPICCIMGHVDTGKTKLLDCIRGTNVQEGEAGGITQQIGATYFPAENIRERTKELKADAKLQVPGLLVIDTPGHESFTNLRSRGSGLCDIAILVVDIMHGLEPQTIESLNLLKMRNTEFIVALNKVDRLYGWKTCKNAPIVKAMKQQTRDVVNEFNMRLTGVITQFKEQGLNTELYYKNKEMGQTFSIVPTSAISGEGIPDLLLLLIQWAQKTMVEKLTYIDEVQCTVLEVKVVEGHGTTIDVVLVNGVLHEGDQIVVCGLQGPIVTTIRALLTPHPMKELRVKGTYLHHKEIKAAQGIKITGQGLEHAIAGTALYVVGPDDDLEDVKASAMEDMRSVMSRIDKSGEGVYVQASTLGSLEALLEFLKTPEVKIPVSGIGIGPVHKKDIMKASVMLERKKEFATILAFDVKVTTEARELADELGVKIFCADIIYHLFDQFKAYIDNIKEEKKKETADEAVFPCVLQILPNCVFNKKDPIVLGVDVVEGIVKVGTPICVPQREFINIGRIASIENNHKPVDYAKKGQKVAIKIVASNPEEQKIFGRHFDMEDELVSHISRASIDILKANYRDELSMEEWRLVVKLKSIFKIQ